MDEDILDVREWIQYAQKDYDGALTNAEANHGNYILDYASLPIIHQAKIAGGGYFIP
ncbi:MAG: hypothetical protein FWC23_03045 [Chitinispirillia bacterium]|nr:hypothetical protein [Chitinispirillia bacterium]MCL2268153.1 hypothetical protein [Chitinispirillia bacterium]